MKKILKNIVLSIIAGILLVPTIVFANSIDTKTYEPDDVQDGTYIIGTYLFENEPMITRNIMVASRTISSDDPADMIIYLKDLDGNWINSLTNQPVTPQPSFDITNIDLVFVLTTNANNLIAEGTTLKTAYDNLSGNPADTLYTNLTTALNELTTALSTKTDVIAKYNALDAAITAIEPQVNELTKDKYLTDYNIATLLGTTISLTNYNDIKEAVTVAITALDNLPAPVQALLVTTRDELMIMSNLADNYADANTYLTTYNSTLALTAATVTIDDKDAITTAETAFTPLPAEVKAVLNAEKSINAAFFTDLLTEIETKITTDANSFMTAHTAILALTEATVEITDKAALLLAETNYNSLPDVVKTKVDTLHGSSVATLLTSLKDIIATKEALAELVEAYLIAHEATLDKTVASITLSDKAAIKSATDAYYNANSILKAAITAEYGEDVAAKLADLNSKISDLETAAIEAFKTKYLSLTSITIDDDTLELITSGEPLALLLDEAVLEIPTLDEDVAEALETEITKINALAKLVTDATAEATTWINTYSYLKSFDLSTATENEAMQTKALIETALTAYETLSANAQLLAKQTAIEIVTIYIGIQSAEMGMYMYTADLEVYNMITEFMNYTEPSNFEDHIQNIRDFADEVPALSSRLIQMSNNLATEFNVVDEDSEYYVTYEIINNFIVGLLGLPDNIDGVDTALDFLDEYEDLITAIKDDDYANELGALQDAIESIETYLGFPGLLGTMMDELSLSQPSSETIETWYYNIYYKLLGFEETLNGMENISIEDIYNALKSLA